MHAQSQWDHRSTEFVELFFVLPAALLVDEKHHTGTRLTVLRQS